VVAPVRGRGWRVVVVERFVSLVVVVVVIVGW
jgi:hypothetical protein